MAENLMPFRRSRIVKSEDSYRIPAGTGDLDFLHAKIDRSLGCDNLRLGRIPHLRRIPHLSDVCHIQQVELFRVYIFGLAAIRLPFSACPHGSLEHTHIGQASFSTVHLSDCSRSVNPSAPNLCKIFSALSFETVLKSIP